MKKNRVFLIVLLIIIVALCSFLVFKKLDSNKKKTTVDETNNIVNEVIDDVDIKYEKEDTTPVEKEEKKENEEIKKEDKEYDQYFVANGFSGASDNVYYTKNKTLYHLILSTNQRIKVAEGVDKIENNLGTILVYKGTNFKILEEDNYLTYVE